MRSTLPCLAVLFLVSCSANTIVTTYPRDFEVVINEQSYGQSPTELRLRNRTFGSLIITIRDGEDGREVFRDTLPTRVNGWGIVWPPFVGLFANLFTLYPQYEIDVTSVASVDGVPAHRPSDERPDPPLWPRRRGLKKWADIGFQFMDRGWLSQAAFWFTRCLQVDPTYPDPMLGLAIYSRQTGDNEAAQQLLEDYRKALEEFESFPPPQRRRPRS